MELYYCHRFVELQYECWGYMINYGALSPLALHSSLRHLGQVLKSWKGEGNEVETKWRTFCRRHFQTYFLWSKSWYFLFKLQFVTKGSNCYANIGSGNGLASNTDDKASWLSFLTHIYIYIYIYISFGLDGLSVENVGLTVYHHIPWRKYYRPQAMPLQWRHDERNGVSNHQCLDCLLNCLFRRWPKKTSKLHASPAFDELLVKNDHANSFIDCFPETTHRAFNTISRLLCVCVGSSIVWVGTKPLPEPISLISDVLWHSFASNFAASVPVIILNNELKIIFQKLMPHLPGTNEF